MSRIPLLLAALAIASLPVVADDKEDPASGAILRPGENHPKPDASKLPHMKVDVKAKQVRVDCEAVNADMPLEFFCVTTGGPEHETVLRTEAKPSHIHLGLLMVGLEPGEPVRYSEAAQKWFPPRGAPIHITCEWEGKDEKPTRVPAYRMMRNVKTKKPMPVLTWVFAGSRTQEGRYGADVTGYAVSVVNFDFTMIDIPDLASQANETLQWEFNPDTCPPKGSKVTMILEPAGKQEQPKPDKPAPKERAAIDANPLDATLAADKTPPQPALSEVHLDEQRVKSLRSKWEKIVKPHNNALREAAQAHYEVINALRAEQNRLIDEADRVQRVIDQLQRDYQDMTTPRPEAPAANGKSEDARQ